MAVGTPSGRRSKTGKLAQKLSNVMQMSAATKHILTTIEISVFVLHSEYFHSCILLSDNLQNQQTSTDKTSDFTSQKTGAAASTKVAADLPQLKLYSSSCGIKFKFNHSEMCAIIVSLPTMMAVLRWYGS